MHIFRFILFCSFAASLWVSGQTPGPTDEKAIDAAAEKKYLFARGLLSRNFHAMAIQEFRLFLHNYPDSPLAPQASRGLVKALVAKGEYTDALAEVEKLQKRWPEAAANQDLALDHGFVLLQLGKPEAAEKVLAAAARDPKSETMEAALYFIAQSREQQQDAQRAMQIYLSLASKPLDETHQYRPYALFAVITSTAKKSAAKADPYLKKLLDSPHVDRDMKIKALQVCAGSAFRAENYAMALTFYDTFLNQFPNVPFASEALKGKLRCLYHTDATDKILALRTEIAGNVVLAGDPEVTLITAAALLRSGQHLPALPLLEKIIHAPGSSAAFREKAVLMKLGALVDTRKFAEAWTTGTFFTQTFPESPVLPDVRRLMATAAFEMEKYAAAETLLKLLLENGAVDGEKHRQMLHMLAVSCQQQNKHAEAADIYRQLAGKAPFDEPRANHRLAAARAAEAAGQPETAIKDYQSLIEGAANNSQANLAAANALVRLSFEQGNFDLTTGILKNLVEKTEGETRIRARLTLILAYLHAGELDAAAKQLAVALQNPPGGQLGGELYYAEVQLALKQNDLPRAVKAFSQVLALPEEDRPDVSAAVLLPLQKEFFRRNDFAASETICRMLLASLPAAQQFEPSVRLVEILITTARLKEAQTILNGLSDNQELSLNRRQEACVHSLRGEVLLKQKKADRAYRAFEKSLEGGLADARTMARSHWGLAVLLKQENRLDEALKQAVGGFVLGNDPYYTPRTMVLAADIFEAQGKDREAANTRAELKTRYPNFVAP